MASTLYPNRMRFEQLVGRSPEFTGKDFFLNSESQYEEILQHIADHKYLINQDIPHEIKVEDAVFSWYENVYSPISRAIDHKGLAHAFPQTPRGELYLWVSRHQHFLKENLGREVDAEEAAISFGAQFSKQPFARLVYQLKSFVAA